MRVAVTGGTGFVGAHCVRALLADGHDVALLVRDPVRVAESLEPLRIARDRCEVRTVDVLDGAAVRRGLADADALLHAANIYSLNAADAQIMRRVNVDGTQQVLRAGLDAGLDPVVHVSSVAALLPSEHLTSRSPVGTPYGPYQVSKADAEAIARGLQDQGAPIVITNPTGVFGPHDPHLGESAKLLRDILRGRLRMVIPGGTGIVDVRDVATAHARLFTSRSGPRRYLMGGRWTRAAEVFRLLEPIVGRRLPRVRVPGGVAFSASRLADVAQRRGLDPGFSSATLWSILHNAPFDDSDTRRDLELTWRSTEETLRDTVAWLHDRDLISARQAGRAAGLGWTINGGTTG
jgi:dihydroflavonol-4-reductase